ncbi:pentapeptide repeat-containing protein [Streptomyces sp. NBC_00885]|uniref:pentapeptide repeat-containing protein n=1 Tax=Streptomyces sp. NBC_00885 TaxID=2975857 RepID=UPI00386A84DE|nr:pentapeptide repeat-containing protein [Streptomyces sp. NBC_00885]
MIASVVTAAGLLYSNAQVRDELKVSRAELSLGKEGQITDRYTAAVDNLGDDAVDVRLGGIYALQRIMEDSPRDQPTIANVLATYVRTHASKPPGRGVGVPADVQAAFIVLATRNPAHDRRNYRADLRFAQLPDIQTPRPSDLNLYDAELQGVDLSGVYIVGADLDSADLTGADLSNANLIVAHLKGADLNGADLSGVKLDFADLYEANLHEAHLDGADLEAADLTGADLTSSDLSNAKLTGADLDSADLTGAVVELKQVISADITSKTKLPPRLAEDPAVKARIAELESRMPQ